MKFLGVVVSLFLSASFVASLTFAEAPALRTEKKVGGGDGHFVEKIRLVASDASASDFFGVAVAISGQTVVVGASGDDDDGKESGSAYIFEQSSENASVWVERQKITGNDTNQSDNFGHSIAIDGDTIVVGAPFHDFLASNAGAAFVFEFNELSGSWSLVEKLVASDAEEIDLFGWTVGVSGDYIAVGAPNSDGEGVADGGVYIFERDLGGLENWGELTKLKAVDDSSSASSFGYDLALSGDRLIAGLHRNQGMPSAAYIFERDGAMWGQVARLSASGGALEDWFGWSVDISGERAVVGARLADDNAGAAYIFERDVFGSWVESQRITAANPMELDDFGHSVGISGEVIAVGAPGVDNRTGTLHIGLASNWADAQQVVGSGSTEQNPFGRIVDIEGEIVVVGAPEEDGDSGISTGAVYILKQLIFGDGFEANNLFAWSHVVEQ